MSKRIRWSAIALGLALAAWLAVGALTAFVATQPAPHDVPPRESLGARPVVELETRAADGVRSVAWFVDGGSDRCAILLSGIHGSRLASLPRASFWQERGWSVLLPDLRGTGESEPRRISFGWNERLDVAAWMKVLRERGVRTIALHGQSLGAAAAVYAMADGERAELLVLDSCYDTAKSALERRLPYVPLPSIAFLPVRWFTELFTNAPPQRMRPVDSLKRISTPTFIAVGSEDPSISRSAAEAMLEASAAKHKVLHFVAGARHEELWLRDAAGLTRALDGFLREAGLD